MLSLVNHTDSNDKIKPAAHGLYRLSVKPTTQIAIETKPVFGANITFHSGVLKHASFIATPDNIIGWIDHGGLSYFSVHDNSHLENSTSISVELPSQFLHVESGVLRVASPTRIYLIAKKPNDIHKHGLCFFTPV